MQIQLYIYPLKVVYLDLYLFTTETVCLWLCWTTEPWGRGLGQGAWLHCAIQENRPTFLLRSLDEVSYNVKWWKHKLAVWFSFLQCSLWASASLHVFIQFSSRWSLWVSVACLHERNSVEHWARVIVSHTHTGLTEQTGSKCNQPLIRNQLALLCPSQGSPVRLGAQNRTVNTAWTMFRVSTRLLY